MEQLKILIKDVQRFYVFWIMGIYLAFFTIIKVGIISFVLNGFSPKDFNNLYRVNFLLAQNFEVILHHPWSIIISIFTIENYLTLVKFYIILAVLFYFIKNLFQYKKICLFIFLALLSVNVFRVIGLYFQWHYIPSMALPTTYFLWLLCCLNIITQRHQLIFEQLGAYFSVSTFFAVILIADLCLFKSFNIWNAVVIIYFYILSLFFCNSKNNLFQTQAL
ncbi:MAG: hypothetical protein ORN85_05690 [Sediminibacterium sp.]|nr:hypothetical protein [Sediminibacterium sp.]